MAVFSVDSVASLNSALGKAKAGDVIKVAYGSYSGVSLNNVNPSASVTITAADPARPPIFTDLRIKNSSNITVSGIEVDVSHGRANSVSISGSKNVTLSSMEFHGSENGNVADDTSAILIRNSTGVTVEKSEFHDLWHGVGFLDSDGVKIVDNTFHDIRTDGVRGGGTSNLIISGNSFTDFYPAPGDHPDAIQLWTTNTDSSAYNIHISDNFISRGQGAPVQGIFLRDQVGDLPFKNVSIVNNAVIGAGFNGISVGHVEGLLLQDNVNVGFDGSRSSISVRDSTAVAASGNHATSFLGFGDDEGTFSNNIRVDDVDIGQKISARIANKNFKSAWDAASSYLGGIVELGYQNLPKQGSPKAFAEIVVSGTAGNDKLSASSVGSSRVLGGDGNDTLNGGTQGTHTLVGGDGDDTYVIRATGNTVVETANGGEDTVSTFIDYTLGDHLETLRLSAAGLTGIGNGLDNRIVGSSGNDRMFGMGGDDRIQAGAGNDHLDGGAGDDELRGEAGDDYILGGDGKDQISGGDGIDTIFGGTGADTIEGGAGADIMSGGQGADVFRWRSDDVKTYSLDVITDFQRGIDKLSLSAIDAKSATAANDAFSFIGSSAFHKIAGELRYEVKNGDTLVYGDIDGNGIADFGIRLQGITGVSAADFVL